MRQKISECKAAGMWPSSISKFFRLCQIPESSGRSNPQYRDIYEMLKENIPAQYEPARPKILAVLEEAKANPGKYTSIRQLTVAAGVAESTFHLKSNADLYAIASELVGNEARRKTYRTRQRYQKKLETIAAHDPRQFPKTTEEWEALRQLNLEKLRQHQAQFKCRTEARRIQKLLGYED